MKGRFLTSLLAMVALAGLQAQTIPEVPKLVVGLTIDQLRMDYIEAFSAMYGERGFKRLWKEGRVYRNAEYSNTAIFTILPIKKLQKRLNATCFSQSCAQPIGFEKITSRVQE